MTPRTQEHRSKATQSLLVESAIEILMERGWAATTAVAVCERAGVTRGALIHHYPTLSALLARALETMCARIMPGHSEASATLEMTARRTWAALSHPLNKGIFEAWIAAANDKELALELRPAMNAFAKSVFPLRDHPEPQKFSDDDIDFLLMAREAMFGLALGRITNVGRPLPHEDRVIARLSREAHERDLVRQAE